MRSLGSPLPASVVQALFITPCAHSRCPALTSSRFKWDLVFRGGSSRPVHTYFLRKAQAWTLMCPVLYPLENPHRVQTFGLQLHKYTSSVCSHFTDIHLLYTGPSGLMHHHAHKPLANESSTQANVLHVDTLDAVIPFFHSYDPQTQLRIVAVLCQNQLCQVDKSSKQYRRVF